MSITVLFDYQGFSQRIGGVSRYHTELFKGLSAHKINYILPRIISDNIYLSENKIMTSKAAVLSKLNKFEPYVKAALNQFICKRALTKNNYDIFHPTFVNPYYLRHIKKPVVVTVHDLIQEKTQRFDAVETSKRRAAQLENASAIICVSEQTKNDLLAFYSSIDFSNKIIKVIYHGVEQEIIRSTVPIVDYPYLLYIGSRESYKNFSNFIKAFSKLKCECHLICTGKLFNSEENQLINNLKIQDRVHNMFVSSADLNRLLNNAIAFVYPSKMEGFGLPILEAFRCCCPAIVSDIDCFHEVAGEAAVFFNPNSIDSMIESIQYIVENDSSRKKLIDAGALRLSSFSWNQCVAEHAKVYQQVL